MSRVTFLWRYTNGDAVFNNTTRRRVDRWAHHRHASLSRPDAGSAHHLLKVPAEFAQHIVHYTKRRLVVHAEVVFQSAARRAALLVENCRYVLFDRAGGAGFEVQVINHIPLPRRRVGGHELFEKEAE